MIKAHGAGFALIGLSRSNILALVAGRPLHTSAKELGYEGSLAIVFGETEEDILAELKAAAEKRGVAFEVTDLGLENEHL